MGFLSDIVAAAKSAFSAAEAKAETVACQLGELIDEAEVELGLKPPPLMQSLETAATEVNPGGGTENCGNIIDAVYERLRGEDPDAVAPTDQDGSWTDIEKRYNTTISWQQNTPAQQGFDNAFQAVKDGGDGTIGIIGIDYDPSGKYSTTSHVVIIANDGGNVGIVEGQGGGGVVTSAEQANKDYNPFGTTEVGFGIVPPGTKLSP